MIRGLLRLVLLIVVIVVAGAFLLGWWGNRAHPVDEPAAAVGTTGEDTRDRARAIGAEAGERTAAVADRAEDVAQKVGERTAEAAEDARQALGEGSLTAKIKAKMALDDYVKALDLNVDTSGSIVTVTGRVDNQAQKDRALALARETAGVTHVVDRIEIRQ